MRHRNTIAALAAALTLTATATAQAAIQPQTGTLAANSVGTKQIANGSIQKRDLRNGLVRFIKAQGGDESDNVIVNAPTGAVGAPGATGPAGPAGPTGPNGMLGAYYSVANYDVGDTNAGAVATVACSNVTDVALSGGVQTLGLDGTPLNNNTPVSSSFPGRMDWDTNTPRPNRLDGWIVQFGGNAGATSDNPPLRVKVYALCLPGQTIPVVETYTQSAD
jgi:hypothetical protein